MQLRSSSFVYSGLNSAETDAVLAPSRSLCSLVGCAARRTLRENFGHGISYGEQLHAVPNVQHNFDDDGSPRHRNRLLPPMPWRVAGSGRAGQDYRALARSAYAQPFALIGALSRSSL